MVPWAHPSPPSNGISIGLADLQGTAVCSTQRHKDHATCDIYRNRPHLCRACDGMRPKIIQH